ncbi:MAG TPA: ABC transporter permease [Candidatus Acidoferrum sp.]
MIEFVQTLAARLLALFRRRSLDRELDAELRSHLDMAVERNLAQGMSREQARRQALLDFGGLQQTKEIYRERRGLPFLDALFQDLRYAFRMLGKSPGFTSIAILTLALGIGANTAIFSAINAVLLRPLPFPNANRLVFVWATDRQRGIQEDVTSYPNFEDWKAQSKTLEALAAFTTRSAVLSNGERAEMVPAIQGTPGIFELLGSSPELGRTFRQEEGEPGLSHVLILSDAFWRERFAGRTDVIGQTLRVNEEPYTIVGVMPAGFRISRERPEQVYAPLVRDPHRGHGFLMVLGRLRPGVSVREARTEMGAIAKRLEEAYPNGNRGVGVNIVPLIDAMAGAVKTGMMIFLGVVGLVLLIACTNVANLMLARGTSRMKEIAVRAALGAERQRILRQLLTESTVLALAGGATGLLASYWISRALVESLKQFNVARLADTHTDTGVLLFTLAVSLVTGIFFGAVFAFSVGSPRLNEALHHSRRQSTDGGRGGRLRGALVVAETAMALVLLAAAGVLLKSVLVMRGTAPGFQTENRLAIEFWLPPKKFSGDSRRIQFFKEALARAEAVHGVHSAALVADLPLGGGFDSLSFHIAGQPDPAPGKPFQSLFNVASPGYFSTMGIPLQAGREFSDDDSADTTPVIVINEAAARRFWPGEPPLGKQISLSGTAMLTVVGVVGDTRQVSLGSAPRPEIFLNYMQSSPEWSWLVMVARTEGGAALLRAALKSAAQQVDPAVPVTRVLPMDEVLALSLAQPELWAGLLAVFAVLAVVLAAVGLYGVVSYLVAERTHEMGIRMALGAKRSDVFSLVVKQGLRLTLGGTLIGIPCALAAAQLLVHLVPNVRPGDPSTLTAVSALLLSVAFAASYIPARRATRVDPIVALRYE